MKQVKIIVNGKPYDVEVGDFTASPLTVNVNGKAYSVEIKTGSDEATVAAPVAAAVSAPAAVSSVPKAATPAPSSSGNDICSPMPGVIVEVSVKPGDKVSVGQQVCALDAMKMKNAIRASRDGVIASVHVTNGQKVAYGDVLVTFES